jgi:hypothetical protein
VSGKMMILQEGKELSAYKRGWNVPTIESISVEKN